MGEAGHQAKQGLAEGHMTGRTAKRRGWGFRDRKALPPEVLRDSPKRNVLRSRLNSEKTPLATKRTWETGEESLVGSLTRVEVFLYLLSLPCQGAFGHLFSDIFYSFVYYVS